MGYVVGRRVGMGTGMRVGMDRSSFFVFIAVLRCLPDLI